MPEAKRPIYGALSDSAVFEIEFLGQDEQMVSCVTIAFGPFAAKKVTNWCVERRFIA